MASGLRRARLAVPAVAQVKMNDKVHPFLRMVNSRIIRKGRPDKGRVRDMNIEQCRTKMTEIGGEAKGIAAQVAAIDEEMDDLLARLNSMSEERDRLAARYDGLNDELESVEEEHDRLVRKDRRRARRLKPKKRVHEATQLIDDPAEIAKRFIPDSKKKSVTRPQEGAGKAA